MDIGALRQEDFEVWMPFQDAEVLVRYVPLEELQEITRRSTRVTWDGKQKTGSLDASESNRLLGHAAVRDWKNITMNRAEFPYSKENCEFLMKRWVEFARFINEVCMDLRSLVEEERIQSEKNSVLTSGQGSTTRV